MDTEVVPTPTRTSRSRDRAGLPGTPSSGSRCQGCPDPPLELADSPCSPRRVPRTHVARRPTRNTQSFPASERPGRPDSSLGLRSGYHIDESESVLTDCARRANPTL